MSDSFPKSERNTLKRLPSRGAYDRESIYAVLDAGFLCHLGFVQDGQPFVIPTAYGRQGDTLFFHGSLKSRTMGALSEGIPACATVTHFDGLVLARSAFHHSMNYRSVLAFGQAVEIEDEAEKSEALRLISEQILRGRWEEVRLPTPNELKATSVLKMTIEEASCKVRTGGPKDDKEDYALPIWAGVVPSKAIYQAPEEDAAGVQGLEVPPSVRGLLP